ncbi:MAG: hypothetical protein HY867_18505 [Chloroflexi bacterium]|nr:hypothetical protein [Chloroflexota bacterium]
MELKDLILLMWRNVRYILLGLILGAGLGWAAVKVQPPVYESATKVYVSRARQTGNADMLSLNDEQLMAINLQLAKSQPVLNEVIAQLGRKVSPDSIEVSAIPNTLIIQIKVEDPDPQQAAIIANLIVQTLIEQNETLLSGWYAATEKSITAQLNQVQTQMDSLQAQISQSAETSVQGQLTQVNQQIEQLKGEIAALEKEIAAFPANLSPLDAALVAEKGAQLERLNSLMSLYQQIQANLTFIGKPSAGGQGLENPQLATLQSTLNLYKQINTNLINSRETVRLARSQSSQTVLQIVPATAPKNQVRPVPNLYLLLGCLVGLALAVTGILLADHFDDSLKSAAQAEKMLGLPVLAVVHDADRVRNEPSVLKRPHSAEVDAFRALAASLDILGAGKDLHQVMVISADPRKTSIAANWAVLSAQAGRRVTLLDGDIKDPRLHELFGLENKNGFAEIADGRLDPTNAALPVQEVDGLALIPGGNLGEASAAWLDAKKLGQLLASLRLQSDLLIVDGPSSDIANAQMLASKMDAVLLAVRQDKTRVEIAQAALRRLQVIGANVVGVILMNGPQHEEMRKRVGDWKSRLRLRSRHFDKLSAPPSSAKA